MIDESNVLESIEYLRRFLNTPQKEEKISNNYCTFCEHNSDVVSMPKNLLSDYNRTYLNISECKNKYTKHDQITIKEDTNSSWSPQEGKEEETKKITKKEESHTAHGNWRKLNKESSSSSSSEILIAELTTSIAPKITKSTAKSADQVLENKIETKMSTVPYFHYKCKNKETIMQPSSQHVKGDCSEYEICAELVYAENNKVLTPEQLETEGENESTSQFNIIQTDLVHINPTQETSMAKVHTNDTVANKNIKENITFTSQPERSEAPSTHIINNTCFHNDEENRTILASAEECTNEANYNNNKIIDSNDSSNKKVISSENSNEQNNESNAFCVKTEKEQRVLCSSHNSECTSSLPVSKNTNNTGKEEKEWLLLESTQLLMQPSISQENEELKIFSSAKMINYKEKSSLNLNSNIIDNDNECKTDDGKESSLTHSASSAAMQNSAHKKEEESAKSETALSKCEEQLSLSLHSLANLHSSPSPSLLHHNPSSSSSLALPLPRQESVKLQRKTVTNDDDLNKCINSKIAEDLTNTEEQCQHTDNDLNDDKEGSHVEGENDLSNEESPQSSSNKKNTNVVVQSVDNTVNIKANVNEEEVNDNENNGGNCDKKEESNVNLLPLTHESHKEEELNTRIVLTAPELVQTGNSSRLAQEHTWSQLWQLLQRGSILLKHVHCHRRPHKRFFNIENVKCYFEGSKAIIPHLVWRSASRREIEKRMNSKTKQSHNYIRYEQCTLQTPNDLNENHNNSSTMSNNDRKSVPSSFFCTSGNPFRSKHLLNLTTLESCEELNEETLQNKTSVAHRLFATRHGCSVDDHWHEIPYNMCAIWTFTTRALAVSFCNGDDHDLWQRAMNYIVCRNKQLFN